MQILSRWGSVLRATPAGVDCDCLSLSRPIPHDCLSLSPPQPLASSSLTPLPIISCTARSACLHLCIVYT